MALVPNSPELIVLNLDEGDRAKVVEFDKKLLLPEEITRRAGEAMDVMKTRPIKQQLGVTVTKVGVVPNSVPDSRFLNVPDDVPKGALFVSGDACLPIPICRKDCPSGQDFVWRSLRTSFSFYRTQEGKVKVILSLVPYRQSSEFLKGISERVAERAVALLRLKTRIYGDSVPAEIFYPLKDDFEAVLIGWVSDKVQEMIDTGELNQIVKAVESERGLFEVSDLRVTVTEDSMSADLVNELKERNPKIPSNQTYVGDKAQQGWLDLCKVPSYGLAGREMGFLSGNINEITDCVGSADNVMIFGIGDAEKEKFLLRNLLQKRGDRKLSVHGIDVGPMFHLRALDGVRALRQDLPTSSLKYRAHVARFEDAGEIADYIRERSGKDSKTLRVSFGNTFGNFDKPWDVYTRGMKIGDQLLVTSDIVPHDLPAEQRQARISEIVARYDIPEWKKWVLNPLYRIGFSEESLPIDNVKVEWDEAGNGVVLKYKVVGPVISNGKGVTFAPGEEIELYRSKKIEPSWFAAEAERNGLKVVKQLSDELGNFGCLILDKVRETA